MRFAKLSRLKVGLILVALAAGFYLYMRPVPGVGPVYQAPAAPAVQPVALPWPAASQSAIGAAGYGLLASDKPAAPVPIASLAKIITALAILQQKPITAGGQGPVITLDSTDLDFYTYYFGNGGSAAKVASGEQITEYQALEGMLLPSANNLADSLARWAFGSVDSYVSYANQMLKQMGITNTTVSDASGFTDNTTSTANDLVAIGLKAIANPVIAQIVGQPSADLPVTGQVKNLNWLLGTDGVDGIKTGNTDKAGGCYLFAASRTIAGQKVTLVGAVLGAPALNSAITGAKALLEASDQGFSLITPVKRGQTLAVYKTSWGAQAQAVAANDLSMLVWKTKDVKIENNLDTIYPPFKAGAVVGSVSLTSGGVSLKTNAVLKQNLTGPSPAWRLFR